MALRQFAELHPDEEQPAVRWLPFQLNPDLPETGIPRSEYIRRKFGPAGNAKYQNIAAVGRSAGLDMAFFTLNGVLSCLLGLFGIVDLLM